MNNPKMKLIDAIKEVAVDDVMEAPREEVIRDLIASGTSIDKLQAMRASVRANAACLLSASRAAETRESRTIEKLPISAIRTHVQLVMDNRSVSSCMNVHIQSEEELLKLYEELVKNGLIKPEGGLGH